MEAWRAVHSCQQASINTHILTLESHPEVVQQCKEKNKIGTLLAHFNNIACFGQFLQRLFIVLLQTGAQDLNKMCSNLHTYTHVCMHACTI